MIVASLDGFPLRWEGYFFRVSELVLFPDLGLVFDSALCPKRGEGNVTVGH